MGLAALVLKVILKTVLQFEEYQVKQDRQYIHEMELRDMMMKILAST